MRRIFIQKATKRWALIGILALLPFTSTTFCAEDLITNAKNGNLIWETTKSVSFFDGTVLHWYTVDEGTVIVPENRNNMNSRLIHLPVVRIHAESDNPAEPIFWLSGGPGSTNIWPDPQDICSWLLKHHDIIMVGYRGVDGPVCLNDLAAIDAARLAILLTEEEGALSDGALQTFQTAWKDALLRLQDAGFDVNGYTVVAVVDDVEAAREALGYERINLFSVSYGTLVASIYSLRHPGSIHRSVMNCVSLVGGNTLFNPAVIDAQLEYLEGLWKDDPDCSSLAYNFIDSIRTVADTLPTYWGIVSLTRDKVMSATYFALTRFDSIPQLSDAYASASQGDYSGLAFLVFAYEQALDLLADTWIDIDYVLKVVTATRGRDSEHLEERSASPCLLECSILHLPTLYGTAAPYVALIDEAYRTYDNCDVPTLMICGSLDFKAPVAIVEEEFLPHLQNGSLVVLRERGHQIVSDEPAYQHLVETFFLEGVVDDSLLEYEPIDFCSSGE